MMEWTTVEDEKLDGLSWKEARDVFDARITTELGPLGIEDTPNRPWVEQAEYRGTVWSHEDKLEFRLTNEPYHGFFVYADEEAINSVLEYANDRKQTGKCFGFIVHNGLVGEGNLDEDDDDPDDSRRYVQRFYAWDLVQLYATVASGGWPDDFFWGDGGISEITSI